MHDKQRSAAGEGDGVQLDCPSKARRNWRSGSIEASVLALYGQNTDRIRTDSAHRLESVRSGVHDHGGWSSTRCIGWRSFLSVQAASSSMSTATLSVVLLSQPRGALQERPPAQHC